MLTDRMRRAALLLGFGLLTGAAPPKANSNDWCIAPLKTLDAETCYVLPTEPTTELLIYLHGLVPPGPRSQQKTNLADVVAKSAVRGRVAALLPRGVQHRSGAYRGFWGWPSGEAYVAAVKKLTQRFQQNQSELERLAATRFTRVYVAGSSAGAYFTTALALGGDFSADGFAALSGGGGRPTPAFPKLTPKPVYIGYGTYDQVESKVRGLARLLREAGWPVRIAAHPTGHGARQVYIEEALEFWRAGG
jgi:predicted esterase